MTLTTPSSPTFWKRVRPWLLAAPALVWPVAHLLARHDWRADLISHFRYPASALTLGLAAALWRSRRRWAVALAALAVVEFWPMVALLGPNPVRPDPAATDRLRVLSANVLASNVDFDRLKAYIRRERPDVLGLIEVTPRWLRELADIRREYPYGSEVTIQKGGLALWSRRPILGVRTEQASPEVAPAMWVDLPLADQTVRVWLVHPPSPAYRVGEVGFPELDALGLRIGRDGGARLVVGDLNTTDGSPHFEDFLEASGLRDGRLGFGPQPSWPTWSPLRITIDHSFVSGELGVRARRLGPDIGSDHRPFLIEVAPVPAAASRTEAASASHASD